jgi:hypothetical protein
MSMSVGRKNAPNRAERKLIMMTMNTGLAALAFGIAVAAGASPAVAQRNNNEVNAARATDLRECNSQAQGYFDYNWGVRQSDIYRACMAEHGQPE